MSKFKDVFVYVFFLLKSKDSYLSISSLFLFLVAVISGWGTVLGVAKALLAYMAVMLFFMLIAACLRVFLTEEQYRILF